MGANSHNRDFSGTKIRTPLEIMRANAIINASNDHVGMGMINFNITAFLPRSREEDALHILGLWAIEPISKDTSRFRRFPEAGQDALFKRIHALTKHLANRPDVTDSFIEKARNYMKAAVEKELKILCAGQTDRQTA